MPHIQAKEHNNPPAFVTKKLSPIDPLPDSSSIREYGVDTLAAGAATDYHYHDCDEWWIFIEGFANVTESGRTYRVGPGDMVYTPTGQEHKIEALTQLKITWFEGPLQGKQRKGHLHKNPEENKILEGSS
jgi:mannose-6-phosphate isomerase-like protein (cupin superfamily)